MMFSSYMLLFICRFDGDFVEIKPQETILPWNQTIKIKRISDLPTLFFFLETRVIF